MKLLTNDLYEGAWLLSQGIELSRMWLDRSGKKVVVFEFTGEDVLTFQNQYKNGKAEVNVVKLKSALREMKDRMFWLIKNEELHSPTQVNQDESKELVHCHRPNLHGFGGGIQTQRSRIGGNYAGITEKVYQR